MAFLVLDKFSSLFGDQRGTGLPPFDENAPPVLTQYCVLAQFDDEDAPYFKQRIDDDDGGLGIRGLVKVEVINDALLEFYVEAVNEQAARIEFEYWAVDFGCWAHVDNVTVVG